MRTAMRESRKALDAAEAEYAGAAVRQLLESFPPFTSASCLLSYVEKGNEVATRPIIAQALRDGRRVMVPVVLDAGALGWSHIDSLDQLRLGRFGVAEPSPEHRRIATPPGDFVVLVPGLAFTRGGHRLGYGAGLFDRFLESHGGTSIGLAYDWQILDSLPVEAHDIPVDFIATPSAILAC